MLIGCYIEHLRPEHVLSVFLTKQFSRAQSPPRRAKHPDWTKGLSTCWLIVRAFSRNFISCCYILGYQTSFNYQSYFASKRNGSKG